VTKYGASREALARLCPLLEHEKRWDELASSLAKEASLAPKDAMLADSGAGRHDS